MKEGYMVMVGGSTAFVPSIAKLYGQAAENRFLAHSRRISRSMVADIKLSLARSAHIRKASFAEQKEYLNRVVMRIKPVLISSWRRVAPLKASSLTPCAF